MSENRMLRRIFGPKRDEVTGGWRKLHNEELFAKYNYNDRVKEDEMGRTCSMNGVKRNAYGILVGKPEKKRSLGKPRCRLVDNIKMNLREIGWGGMDRIDLTPDRDQWRALVNMAMNPPVPYIFGKFLSSCTTGGFSRRACLNGIS
jgi:hypothetical protein